MSRREPAHVAATDGRLRRVRLLVLAAALALAILTAVLADDGAAAGRFTLTSPAFAPGGRIPAKHTCDGGDAVLPLAWTGAPAGTRSFALIMDDPDTPFGTFLHRIAWGIPGTAKGLPGKAPVEGVNGAGRIGWMGPCPPSGVHRYVFRLFALKSAVPLKKGASLDELEAALKSRTLGMARLVGRYGR